MKKNKLLYMLTLTLAVLAFVFISAMAAEDNPHEGHDHASGEAHKKEAAAEVDPHADCDHDHEAEVVVEEDSHAGHDHAAAPNDEHEGHGAVELTVAEIAEFGVIVQRAGPGNLNTEIIIPGEIAVHGDRIAHIVPRFPGVVKNVHKAVGDRVRTGDILAVIESNESLAPYEIESLISGTIIDKHITVGEVRSDAQEPAFVIADLDSVWVNLNVYQMYLADVRVGQKVVVICGEGVDECRGVISYISPIVDEHTRTGTARVVLSNSSGHWRPGQFVTGRIAVQEDKVDLAIPLEAIQTLHNEQIVFVRDDHGFEARDVKVGKHNSEWAEVLSGLQPGDEYVSKGGFVLKAQLLKGGFDDGHNH